MKQEALLIIDTRIRLFGASALMVLLAGLAVADDVRELSWEDLQPEAEASLQIPPGGGGSGAGDGSEDELDWRENTFEDALASPIMPSGVVEELDGTQVKLPGFIVPLEVEDDGKVKEFLLVPYFGACIHYPPPPPNQIVYVIAGKATVLESMWDPVWVTGEIRTKGKSTEMASASYTMQAKSIEVYEY